LRGKDISFYKRIKQYILGSIIELVFDTKIASFRGGRNRVLRLLFTLLRRAPKSVPASHVPSLKGGSIALVLDPVTIRRLARGMYSHFLPDRNFWLLDISRPLPDLLAKLKEWNPDGLVTRWMPKVTDALIELGLPTALTGGYVRASNVVCVGMDHAAIGAAAAEYFLSLGLRTFAFYGKDAAYSKSRQESFIARLKVAGHSCHLYRESDQEWETYMEHLRRSDEPLEQWLRDLPKPVGIFATHDPMAWHVVQICRGIGLGVPEQVAVLGTNDDDVFCNLANPPLSSVSIPWDRIGGELALALERLMAHRKTKRKPAAPPAAIPIPPGPVVARQSSNLLAVDNPILLKALRFIQEHLSDSLTVKDLLRVVPMSRRRLEVEFRRCLGRTPKDEILRMRIENAKRLLAQTDLQMPLVAERSGFAYTERFSTVFKRKTGTTPTAYRREHRLRA